MRDRISSMSCAEWVKSIMSLILFLTQITFFIYANFIFQKVSSQPIDIKESTTPSSNQPELNTAENVV